MATTAVASCCTSPWAMPPNGSIASVRADRQALSTTIRSGSWSRRYGPRTEDVTAWLLAVLVLEVDDALAQPVVEVAVPHEVDDVGLVRAQPGTEVGERGAGQPVDDHDARVERACSSASPIRRHSASTSSSSRSVGEEMIVSTRSGPSTAIGRGTCGHVEEAHDWRALRLGQEVVGPDVVQQLPRQPGDRGRVVEPQPQPQAAGLLGAYLVEAALPGQGEVAVEDRLVERTAEVHGGLLLARGADPAGARSGRGRA